MQRSKVLEGLGKLNWLAVPALRDKTRAVIETAIDDMCADVDSLSARNVACLLAAAASAEVPLADDHLAEVADRLAFLMEVGEATTLVRPCGSVQSLRLV